jgi:hypothetical protein
MEVVTSPLPGSLETFSKLLDADTHPPKFVVAPYIPRGELIELVGAHGNFKSTLALDVCMCIATCRPWGGIAVEQGRVVFITLEDTENTLARRAKAWLAGIYEPSEIAAAERDLRANALFLSRERAQPLILTTTSDGATTARLDVADHLASLVRGAVLVVLETASRLHDGPETNDAFAALVRALEHVTTTTGAAVMLVRHMSKKAAREMVANQVDSYAGRGGGALSDAVRSSLVVTRPRGEPLAPITVTLAKATHAQAGATMKWMPINDSGVGIPRLEPWTAESAGVHDADELDAYILLATQASGGITHSALHKKPPAGLGRAATQRALALLLARGTVKKREEPRGRSKQVATIYYVPIPGLP